MPKNFVQYAVLIQKGLQVEKTEVAKREMPPHKLQPSLVDRVLTPKVLEYMDSLSQDKEKALDFLKKYGFVDENNQLAKEYR